MFNILRKAQRSMWLILLLLISFAILLRVWSTQVYSDQIFAWFRWFKPSWLYFDISRPQINVFISFTHCLVNKLQKILETNPMISQKLSKAHQSWHHRYRVFISNLGAAILGAFSQCFRKPSDFLIVSTMVCAISNFRSWFCFCWYDLFF